MSQNDNKSWHKGPQQSLGLAIPPIGIAFLSSIPAGIDCIGSDHATTNG